MKIVALNDDLLEPFSVCLEDWSDEAWAAGPRRREWIEKSRKMGMRARLALDDADTPGGQIQYMPIEHSFVDGQGLYMIHCIWIHGYRKGRGNYQKRGMGCALLRAAEEDARALDARGMAAWGMWLPMWMKASWFKRYGYRKADTDGLAQLVYKPFTEDAVAPRWFRQRKPIPRVEGRVTVTAFNSGWCMAQNLVYERAKRASRELGPGVVFQEFDTSERDVLEEWGISDKVFVDGKSVQKGPPPSYEKIHRIIEKRLRKL